MISGKQKNIRQRPRRRFVCVHCCGFGVIRLRERICSPSTDGLTFYTTTAQANFIGSDSQTRRAMSDNGLAAAAGGLVFRYAIFEEICRLRQSRRQNQAVLDIIERDLIL